MNDIQVQSSKGSYPIHFGKMGQAFNSIPHSAVVISDSNVIRHWGDVVPEGLATIIVEPGESSKSIAGYSRVTEEMASRKILRNTTIVALGGGVVGDLAGFVASTYMRGVELLQIPTSLLAMVDSSVGGKVGIDLPQGKNLLGSFYPPIRVLVPIDALSTLPERHMRNGMAEVWKYAFIADVEMARQIESTRLDNIDSFAAIIENSIRIKAEVCAKDEFDRTGDRAILNFGHTIGHAIEAELEYEEILHGEAISIGMVVEARIAELIGVTDRGLSEWIKSRLQSSGLPVAHDILSASDRLIDRMRIDKKSTSSEIGMALVTEPGKCKLFDSVPHDAIRGALTGA